MSETLTKTIDDFPPKITSISDFTSSLSRTNHEAKAQEEIRDLNPRPPPLQPKDPNRTAKMGKASEYISRTRIGAYFHEARESRQLVLLIVAIALLLDNMLLTTVGKLTRRMPGISLSAPF